MAEDAGQRSGTTDVRSVLKLDFDVTEASSIVPRRDVVGWPDQGVDEIEEVELGDPEDQSCGCKVMALHMGNERRD